MDFTVAEGVCMFVVTADQVRSRRHTDRVPAVLQALAGLPHPPARLFERTAGDEIQGVAADAACVVDVVTALVRDGHWRIGIGIGPVDEPLPLSPREGSGPAFLAAREAVTAARSMPTQLAVRWQAALTRVRRTDDDAAGVPAQTRHAEYAETTLMLYARLLRERTLQGWAVTDLLGEGLAQHEAAARLEISPSAVSQRVRRAGWLEQGRAAGLAIHHLSATDGRPGPTPAT